MIQEQEYDKEKYLKVLFQTFEAFIATCEKYNLRYFCAGGTVLGAVRHQNIIPWDDDIDVFMPREDYEKIIELNSKISKEGYSIICAKNTDWYGTFGKFYNKNTTLWEFKEIPFIYGVFIDIFPLDETNDDVETFLVKYKKLRNAQRKYLLSQMRFEISDIIKYYKQGDKKYFYKGVLSWLFPRFLKSYFKNNLLKCEEQFICKSGHHIVCPYGEYYKKEYQEKSWYEDYALLPFGNLQVRVPQDYEGFLRHVYGDYMKLPPKEKQLSHHYHYLLDLDKGLTLAEVKKIMKGAR